jgi:hypothetical protein
MSGRLAVNWQFKGATADSPHTNIIVNACNQLDSVKQDVRFTDNHLGRSAEGIVAG